MRFEIHKGRRFIQALFFMLFVLLLALTAKGLLSRISVELFLVADPLVVLSALSRHLYLRDKFLFGLITAIVTLGLGRVFCGYACPLGTILDLGSPIAGIFKIKRGTFSKLKPAPVLVLVFVLVMTILGVNVLMALDPIVLLTRTATVTLFPALDYTLSKGADVFYGFPALAKHIDFLTYKLSGLLMFDGQRAFEGILWISLPFLIIVGMNILGKRFWCRYLCPLGGLLGLLGRIPLWRKRVDAEVCTNCQSCVRVCDMGAISDGGLKTDAANCNLCLKCKDVCPQNAVSVAVTGQLTIEMPSRRAFIATVGLSAAAVYALPVKNWPKPQPALMIRPPGALAEDQFPEKCIRCGACLKVCPSNVLQPALLEYGLDAIWTPHLNFAVGVCEMGCNSCGRVCPTRAIKELKLADKQRFVIGLAKLDKKRCIAWQADSGCSVCQELCPVADKAIEFHEAKGASGKVLQRPYVIEELCIGCGVCENKCPVKGRKAIRVFKADRLIK